MNLPDVWPDGGIFAYSGMDGETSWRRPLHAVPSGSRFALALCCADGSNRLAQVAELVLPGRIAPGRVEGAVFLGDCLSVPAREGSPAAVVAFRDRRTLVGSVGDGAPELVPPAVNVVREGADERPRSGRAADATWFVADGVGALCLALSGTRFALVYDESSSDAARGDALAALERPPELDFERRSAYQRALGMPDGLDAASERLLRKCASVLKANVESPQGCLPTRWTTPDRLPHRDMWLWDSAFHAIALAGIDPALAREAVLAPLSRVRPDGFLPHRMAPDAARESGITQPPILAWAAWKVYGKVGDRSFLEAAYGPASACLRWDLDNRRAGDLLNWLAARDPTCRCDECGMDNSPRFDPPGVAAALDFSAYAALEAGALARVAAELGRDGDAASWEAERDRIASAIERRLWDDRWAIYRDLGRDQAQAACESVAAFLPLAAGAAGRARARRLLATLTDPARFWRPLPVPTVAADDPSYSDDMWRGPVWLNVNYLVIEGLRRYGFREAAASLAARTLAAVLDGYEAEGVVFEFYDPERLRPSGELRRKGRPGRQAASSPGVIRDYGWTAAVTFALLAEGETPLAGADARD